MTFTKNKLNLLLFLFFNFFSIFCIPHSAITTNDNKTTDSSTTDSSSDDDIKTGNSAFDDLLNQLKNMSCESMKYYEVFVEGDFKNSCITSSILGVTFAAIQYPTAVPLMLRVRINDKKLFGKDQCSVKNHANYNDPRLTFGICSNIKIALLRTTVFVANVPTLIIAFSGGDWDKMWQAFSNILFEQSENYKKMFEIFEDKKVGDSGMFFDVPAFPISWSIIKQQDTICLATKGVFGELFDSTEYLPIGCKYITEPYTKSIYADVVTGEINNKLCSNFGTCYKDVTENSKALRSISSTIIYCTYQVLTKALVSPDVCTMTDANDKLSSGTLTKDSMLYKVQDNLRSFVKLFLTLYIMSIGYKMMLYGSAREDVAIIVLKIILVIYFSIGIDLRNNQNERQDGMSGFTIPLLMNASNSFASWIMNAGSSGLCSFSESEYAGNYKFLALWDSVDCRLGHYLGIDMVAEFYAENFKKTNDWSAIFGLSFPVPPYLYLLAIGLYTGFTTLTELALAYPILIISVIAYFVQVFISSVIMILVFGIMAPLFVPMVLFEATKGYFNKWLDIMISFSLKPMVVSAFLIVMFSVYDRGFYGTCKHSPEDYNGKKAFVLMDKESDYADKDYENCIYSLGYILHSPGKALFKMSTDEFLKQNSESKNFADAKKNNNFLSEGVETKEGVFSDFFVGVFSKLEKILMSMLIGCVTLYLIQMLSGQLEQFLADLSKGVNSNTLSGSILGQMLGGAKLDINPSNISRGLKKASSFAVSKLDNLRKNYTNKNTKLEADNNKLDQNNNPDQEQNNNNLEPAHQVNVTGNFQGNVDRQESTTINPDGSKTTTTSFKFSSSPLADQNIQESKISKNDRKTIKNKNSFKDRDEIKEEGEKEK